MSASGEISKESKYVKEINAGAGTTQTTTPDKGGEGRETNTGNRTGRHIRKREEIVQLHTIQRNFKNDTPEVGSLLGLMSKKIDIGMTFDNFREKLKGYVEINIDYVKYVICVVTDIEDPMIFLKRETFQKIQIKMKPSPYQRRILYSQHW